MSRPSAGWRAASASKRVEAEAQHLAVGHRAHGDRARAAVQERGLAERRDRVDDAAGRLQPAVDEQIQGAVALACLDHDLARAEEPRLGVVEQRGPVVLAAPLEEAGQAGGGALIGRVVEEAVVSMLGNPLYGWMRVRCWIRDWVDQGSIRVTESSRGWRPRSSLRRRRRRPGVPTGIAAPDLAGGGVDPGHRVVVAVGDPDGAEADGDLARVGADRDRVADDLAVLRSSRVTVSSPALAIQTLSPSRSRRAGRARRGSGRRPPGRSTGRCG